jgi:hypothetical protein
MALLSDAGFPATAGPLVSLGPVTPELVSLGPVTPELLFFVSLKPEFDQNISLRSTGKTIGSAGKLFFGVGAAIKSGAPDGINVNDYFPTHAASGSFM